MCEESLAYVKRHSVSQEGFCASESVVCALRLTPLHSILFSNMYSLGCCFPHVTRSKIFQFPLLLPTSVTKFVENRFLMFSLFVRDSATWKPRGGHVHTNVDHSLFYSQHSAVRETKFKDVPQSEIQIHHCDAPTSVFTGYTTGRETRVLAGEKLWAPEGKGPCREIIPSCGR
jgi:hypothetical protein